MATDFTWEKVEVRKQWHDSFKMPDEKENTCQPKNSVCHENILENTLEGEVKIFSDKQSWGILLPINLLRLKENDTRWKLRFIRQQKEPLKCEVNG